MRRRVVIVPIVLLAGILLARRRRRVRAASAPLTAPPQNAPVALLESGARFVSVPWTLREASPDAPHVKIACSGDEHMELDRVDAQETPTQVFVTVLMHWRAPADGRFAATRAHEAVVTLGSPLGARELVHTPVDVETADERAERRPSAPPLYP